MSLVGRQLMEITRSLPFPLVPEGLGSGSVEATGDPC